MAYRERPDIQMAELPVFETELRYFVGKLCNESRMKLG